MKISTEQQALAEQFQDECQKMVEMVMKQSKKPISYQDATNVWLFQKLAKQELEIRKLKGFYNTQRPIGTL